MQNPGLAEILFITGTDTGVGKTRVAAALVNALSGRGYRTSAFKPVAAGADAINPVDGMPCNSDALQLLGQANAAQSYSQVNPVLLEEAIAPHIAARNSGVEIDPDDLVCVAQAARRGCDFLVIEGAGGWLVPINSAATLADVAAALRARVLLVVGMRLGCLNHALLSAAAIRSSGCELAGWIANCIDPGMPELSANIDSLQARLRAPLLGRLEWAPGDQPADIATQISLESLLLPRSPQ